MRIETVLIAGGYGVVGAQIARLLRQHRPHIRILLGGRTPENGTAVAAELGGAKAVRLDLADADPLAALEDKPDAVLSAVNDIDDHLMLGAIRAHIPYIDITRWTERLRGAMLRAAMEDTSHAPVIFASSWMAAVPGILARDAACTFERVRRIDMHILYAAQDKSGPNSVEYMDRMAIPFEVREEGRAVLARPFRKAVPAVFPGAGRFKLYRFDTPDQLTLPLITGAGSVAARIGFDDKSSGPLLSFLVRSGIWNLLSRPRFKGLRHGLLHNPGEGAPHRVRLDVEGAREGRMERESWLLTDPEGQTHLTATGAFVQLDRLIRAREAETPLAGIQIAEAVSDAAHLRSHLQAAGITLTPVPAA